MLKVSQFWFRSKGGVGECKFGVVFEPWDDWIDFG